MRYVLAVILTTMLSAPAWAQKTIEEIVAKINNEVILKSEYEAAKQQLRQQLAQQAQQQGLQGAQLEREFAEQSRHLLRSMIDQILILQKAKDMGLNADLEVIKNMEKLRQEYNFPSLEALEKAIVDQGSTIEDFKQNIRSQYLSGQVLGREVDSRIIVTTDDIRNHYESHKKDFDRPEGVRIREITIITEKKTPQEIEQQRKKAEDALAAVKRGDDFAEVAQKYSESDTAQDGGELGFFAKGQLAKPLEEAAAKLEKGQAGEILTVQGGFMIIKLEDKHTGGVLALELARDEIQDLLWRQRRAPKIREYLTKLRTEGFVQVNQGYEDTGAPPKISQAKPAQ